jgi:hypothetical protein
LPEGGEVVVSGQVFRITYVGGDGNDVVLMSANVPPQFTSVQHFTNGDVIVQGTAAPGKLVTLEVSQDLVNFQINNTAVADGAGRFSFLDNVGTLTNRFYRAFTP